jgi:hypothetical protein
MRVVYGAGAIAAMSAMTVGLVQPDFSSLTDDTAPAADEQAAAAEPGNGNGNGDGNGRRARQTGGRRVIRYVFLQPGADAPDGARVITAAEAARRGIAPGGAGQDPTRSRDAGGSATQPDRGDTQRNTQPSQPDRPAQPARPAQPRPEPPAQPDPPVRTHQSG